MRKILLLVSFLTVMLISACAPKVYTEEDIMEINLSSSTQEVKLGTGNAAIFTVVGLAEDGTEIPCNAEFYCDGELLDKPYLETSIPGTYTISAKFNEFVSSEIKIKVLPEDLGYINLTLNRNTIFKGGRVTFKAEAYTKDNELLSEVPEIYVGDVLTDGKSHKTTDLGFYIVEARLDGVASAYAPLSVKTPIEYNVTLSASKTDVVAGGESVTFTTLAEDPMGQKEIDQSLTKIHCIQTNETIEGKEFKPTTAGRYTFYAESEDIVSAPVTIVVTEPSIASNIDFNAFPGYESELPVIIIDTYGKDVTKEKSTATMYIYNKEINKPGDAPDVVSLIDIKLRGQSSLEFPKKQYSIHTKNEDGTNNNISLLGMPAENDWVLNGSYADKSLIKNSLMYDLMGKVTEYSARNEFCEVYITRPDGSLDYVGIYSLIEKIKIDQNRVNIHKMTETDTNITGGYIVSIDKIVADEVFVETSLWDVTIVSPNKDKLTDAQYDYIAQYLKEFSLALEGENRADPENGYRKYFEPESIVGQLLLDEWIRNIDCMRFSAYFYKEQDGKLKFGPPWDFDITCGRCDYGEGWIVEGWEMGSMNDLCCHLMWDPTFVQMFVDTWKEYRTTFLTDELIVKYIDDKVAELGEAPLARSLARWSRQWDGETYVWPNPVDELYSSTHAQEIQFIKDYLLARAEWIDNNIDDLLVGDIKKKIW